MPFYSQSDVDDHHRRVIHNNQTHQDSEFENGSRILNWYMKKAKQVLYTLLTGGGYFE